MTALTHEERRSWGREVGRVRHRTAWDVLRPQQTRPRQGPKHRILWGSVQVGGSTQFETSKLRLALYASAENLAHYARDPDLLPDYLRDDRARDRHRFRSTRAQEEDLGAS